MLKRAFLNPGDFWEPASIPITSSSIINTITAVTCIDAKQNYLAKDRRPKIGGYGMGREGELDKEYNLLCPGKSIAHFSRGIEGLPKRIRSHRMRMLMEKKTV